MANFQMPIERPEEIIPRLGKQERHWKVGRSAYELSTTWMRAGGFPPSVTAVLDQAPEWRSAEFLEGIFERETELPGRGKSSQTDLLAIVRLKDGNAILGVEGKVDEPFDALVRDWLAGAPVKDQQGRLKEPNDKNRRVRLAGLCATLQVDPNAVGALAYQLFHRTCASIYEARRFGYKRAVMLVHSFAESPALPAMPACFNEFSAFASAVGMPLIGPGSISALKCFGDIEVRLAWVSDTPSR